MRFSYKWKIYKMFLLIHVYKLLNIKHEYFVNDRNHIQKQPEFCFSKQQYVGTFKAIRNASYIAKKVDVNCTVYGQDQSKATTQC